MKLVMLLAVPEPGSRDSPLEALDDDLFDVHAARHGAARLHEDGDLLEEKRHVHS